ncbi:hypothetical protein M0R45_000988 [Rubus argutus]|uniref:Uncharacterized protein n=1 Tax=Rubus argutus TaxID=59490 RepID=A0AAW1VIX7_RUBAR
MSLSDECKFESIPIVNDSGTSNIDTIEGLKCVCAITVNTLLRQIIGLTSVAQSRSLAARDILLKMQRHHDRNQRGAFGPSIVGSKMGGTPIYQEIPQTLEKILDKFDFQREHEVATNVDPIMGFCSNVTHYKLDNSTGFTSDSDSEMDTHEYAVSDLPYGALKVEACVADKSKTTAAVPILPDDLQMKSKYHSKF